MKLSHNPTKKSAMDPQKMEAHCHDHQNHKPAAEKEFGDRLAVAFAVCIGLGDT